MNNIQRIALIKNGRVYMENIKMSWFYDSAITFFLILKTIINKDGILGAKMKIFFTWNTYKRLSQAK